MATVSSWNPYGVALDITATSGTVTRTSATAFTVVVNASWKVHYSGANTNYGMVFESGGVGIYIPKYTGSASSSGSGSLTGTYSISGNGTQTKSISTAFTNYNEDANNYSTYYIDLDVSVPAWTSYTVTYNANGGSGAPSSQTKWKDQTLTLSSTTPTRDGWTFVGWGTSSTATSATYSVGGSYTNNSSITLYAIWSKTIKLTYNANNGSGAPSSQSATIYNATTSYTFTVSSTKPTRTGYTFLGWSTSSTATSASYSAGGSCTLSDSTTLYAIWSENKLTVNYYSNYATEYGGTYEALNTVNNNNVLVYSANYYYDNSYSSGLLNYKESGSSLYMTRAGYFATGYWGTTISGGTLIDQDDTSYTTGQAFADAFGKSLETGNASVNVYAQWEPANVAYYKNNGKYVLCNTYGKVDGKWQPMLFYGKINGSWVRGTAVK